MKVSQLQKQQVDVSKIDIYFIAKLTFKDKIGKICRQNWLNFKMYVRD